MSDKIQAAAQHYVDLKHRRRHPVGKFDRGGRWYPAQEHTCCESIRGPSRAYPYSLLTHCRSAAHVAAEHGVEKAALLKAAKALPPEPENEYDGPPRLYDGEGWVAGLPVAQMTPEKIDRDIAAYERMIESRSYPSDTVALAQQRINELRRTQ